MEGSSNGDKNLVNVGWTLLPMGQLIGFCLTPISGVKGIIIYLLDVKQAVVSLYTLKNQMSWANNNIHTYMFIMAQSFSYCFVKN